MSIRKYFYKKKRGNAFTLIEMLVVIAIAAVLATITLNLNRSRIQDMKALSEREQWLDRHTHINREFTNTNYLDKQKLSRISMQYTQWATGIIISGTLAQDLHDILLPITIPSFQYHTISGNLTIIKTPLQLWCTTQWDNDTIYLLSSGKSSCFKLNTSLCSRVQCK